MNIDPSSSEIPDRVIEEAVKKLEKIFVKEIRKALTEQYDRGAMEATEVANEVMAEVKEQALNNK